MLAASSGARDDFIVGATHISKELICCGVFWRSDASGAREQACGIACI